MRLMDRNRWQKIESILDEALSIKNRKSKKDYIKKACAKDPELYREINLILQSILEAEANGFLEP